jgi:hypothetical protein
LVYFIHRSNTFFALQASKTAQAPKTVHIIKTLQATKNPTSQPPPMAFPPSASLENPSMPNAIHSFSSAAPNLSPPVWAPIFLGFLCICVLWSSLDLPEPLSGATASAVPHRLPRLGLFIFRSVLSFDVGVLAYLLTHRQDHPRLLLAALKRSLPIHVTVVDARQARFIARAKAREREADRRAHAQLVEDLRALLLILTSGGGGGGGAAAAAGAGDAAVPATMPAALPAPSPAAGPPALSVQ